MHPIGLQQMLTHCVRRPPSYRLHLTQACWNQKVYEGHYHKASSYRLHLMQVCWNTVQSIIEGSPAGCDKTAESRYILLFECFLVRGEENTRCPEFRRSCPRCPLDDLEFLTGGRKNEGESCPLDHLCITHTGGDEMAQRCRLIFSCSTPSDPFKCLSKYPALGSKFKSDCKFLHSPILSLTKSRRKAPGFNLR